MIGFFGTETGSHKLCFTNEKFVKTETASTKLCFANDQFSDSFIICPYSSISLQYFADFLLGPTLIT